MELRRKIRSKSDGLPIDIVEVVPEAKEVKGIIQIVHGMAEHKERYLHFMNYLAEQGYACIAHDHRGHGNSVLDPADLGYFTMRAEKQSLKMFGMLARIFDFAILMFQYFFWTLHGIFSRAQVCQEL